MFINPIIKSSFIAFIAFSALISCSGNKPNPANPDVVQATVIGNGDGAFRGLNLGDNINTASKKETSKPLEADSAYLYYEYALPDSMGSFNLTYNFDENGLFEIQSDIFINNSSQTEAVFNNFKSYFDKFYGASQTEMGFSVWSVKSEKFGHVKINLSDESNDFTIDNAPGKLSLWIYKDEANS